jgi:hypothetical protein
MSNLANIADPSLPKKKSIDTQLFIYLDRNAKEARLVIPRSQLKQLRAELEGLDSDAPTTAGPAVTRTQTIVSGGLLSLSFIFAGMWFMRSGSQHSKTGIAAAVLLATGSIATIVYGNAGPPPEASSITGKMFSQAVHSYKQGSGSIKLEVSDEERNPVLFVPDPRVKTEE